MSIRRLSVGDRIHVLVVGRREDGSPDLSGDDVPDGWVCELAARKGETAPEAGRGMFVRVLDVIPQKRLVTVTANQFGFEHLNAKRRERYLIALDVSAGCLEGGWGREDATIKDAISEVKGMFTQCQLKNQPAWYRVWQALGEPSRGEAARWARELGELGKSHGDPEGHDLRISLASGLVRKGLPEMLHRAAESIRDEGLRIAGGEAIDNRPSLRGEVAGGEHHRRAPPEETQHKLITANARHEAVIQHLRQVLEDRGLTIVENRFVDAQCVLPDGGSLLFEVKSLATDNELAQMRSGIAQLYEYRYREDLDDASLWLVFSRRPQQEPWMEHYLEEDRDIRVLWLDSGELRGPSLNRLPTTTD